jgi:hypothetical protein
MSCPTSGRRLKEKRDGCALPGPRRKCVVVMEVPCPCPAISAAPASMFFLVYCRMDNSRGRVALPRAAPAPALCLSRHGVTQDHAPSESGGFWMSTDPVELTAALVRCPSVTPEEGGALQLLEKVLGAGRVRLHPGRPQRHAEPLCALGATQRAQGPRVQRTYRRRARGRPRRLDAPAVFGPSRGWMALWPRRDRHEIRRRGLRCGGRRHRRRPRRPTARSSSRSPATRKDPDATARSPFSTGWKPASAWMPASWASPPRAPRSAT